MNSEIELTSDTKIFGFWIYLMTDLIIFAVLFAIYIVLRGQTFGGLSSKDFFEMPLVLAETLILLVSSFTCALGMLAVHKQEKKTSTFWFLITFVLGTAFLTIEIWEFSKLMSQGNGPARSAFLSSFFTLVGTHGLHIFCGLIWMLVELGRIWLRSLSTHNISRIFRMVLFWHFLDFVWIFIFTTVYGMGYLL